MSEKKVTYKRHKVVTHLERKEIDFLDSLGKDAMFSTGHRLSYDDILRALVEFIMEIGVSGTNVCSWQDLRQRCLERSKINTTSEQKGVVLNKEKNLTT